MDFLTEFEMIVEDRIRDLNKKLDWYSEEEKGLALGNKVWIDNMLQLNKHWLYCIKRKKLDGRYKWNSNCERLETGTLLT